MSTSIYRKTELPNEADININGVCFKKVSSSDLTPKQILSNLYRQHRFNCKLLYPTIGGFVCKVHGNYVHIVISEVTPNEQSVA